MRDMRQKIKGATPRKVSKIMGKFERQQENEKVIQWCNVLANAVNMVSPNEIKRLRSCNATVYVYKDIDITDENGVVLLENETIYLLFSYNTAVAAVIESMNFGVDYLRLVYGYTATSSQHIAKFFKDYLNPFHPSHTIQYHE